MCCEHPSSDHHYIGYDEKHPNMGYACYECVGRSNALHKFEKNGVETKCDVCAHPEHNHLHNIDNWGKTNCEACISGVSNHRFVKARGEIKMVTNTNMIQVEIPREVDFDLVDIISRMDGQSRDAQVAILVRLTAKAFMEGRLYEKEGKKKK